MSDLLTVRDWVGSTPDDTAINAELARFEGANAPLLAARSILRRRRADLVAGPASFAVEGDYRETRSAEQLKALDATLRRLGDELGEPESSLEALTQSPLAGPPLPR